ncbi:MAG: hypothetical protein J5857_05920 [Treponema sp.]|nr:hypothetical protein [Treponema sp.]
MKKLFLLFIFSLFISAFADTGSNDKGLKSFAQANPDAYKDAVKLSLEIRFVMQKMGYQNCDFALAVVFPELMRYSAFRDEMETFANEILYSTSLDAEGCSIGFFQIKPIFAESVEIQIAKNPALKQKYAIIDYNGDISNIMTRQMRIMRLTTPETEIAYLFAFIDICMDYYSLEPETPEDNLKIIAAAYNSGYFYKRETLEKISSVDSYPYGSRNTPSWNYVQISSDYYRILRKK